MRKLTAVLILLALILSLSTPALASDSEPQLIYSSLSNSGVRNEVCTDLSGTTASRYYTGDYAYEILFEQSGDTLLQQLRTLMTETHTHKTTYSDCRDLAVKTDCENGDGETINLIYTSYVATMDDYINNTTDGGGWNREHVWPTSLGGFNKDKVPGCDLHHIRPSDKSVNGKRGNEKYGIPSNGSPVTGTVTVGNAVGGYSNGQYFEPLDNVKGDVARICLYVYARYGAEYPMCNNITTVFQSVDVLLDWCASDPVDTWEMGRNEVVYAIQGNRNVFIDYPELAWLIFDQEVPEDLVTPSAQSRTACAHANVETVNAAEATCNTAGYTGDVVCLDCGETVTAGEVIRATGKHTYSQWLVAPGGGEQSRECTVCGYSQTISIEDNEDDAASWIWIAAGAAGVAAVGVVIVLVVKKKKQ